MMYRIHSAVAVAAALTLAFAGTVTPAAAQMSEPTFGNPFWSHWGDGLAEICSYDLTFPRYGKDRTGTAITIFVTETFSRESRVKADPGVHAKTDEVPVIKLNLVQDFPTGIYDYNMMLSAFYDVTRGDGRPAGSPIKVAFSSQEWCGQVFHELLPDAKRVRSVSHSYFDGEADRADNLPYPRDALFEDGLLHWARGWAAPALAAGESRTVQLLRSTEFARLRHVPVEWETAEVEWPAGTTTLEVPAGTFEVETRRVKILGDAARTWTFHVEAAPPYRIVRWETDGGRRADLVASERMAYWQMNGPGFEKNLEQLGLEPRPGRTP